MNQQFDVIDDRTLRLHDRKFEHRSQLRRRYPDDHGCTWHDQDEADIQNAGVTVFEGVVVASDVMHSAMSLGVPMNHGAVMVVCVLAALVNVLGRSERDPHDRRRQRKPGEP